MARLTLLLAAAATLTLMMSFAEARDGCGRGWFYNGRACVQEDDDGPTYYRPPPRPSYDTPRYYRERRNPNPDCYFYRGRRICCPHRWTVQDGVCKPYRGF